MSADAGSSRTFDLIIRNGQVFDGSGGEPYTANVAIAGDRIAAIGAPADARAGTVIDAAGLAVAPGFINMLSHAYFSMLQDPRSLSDLKQGVTTQIFGEGHSMGPLTDGMRERMIKNQPRLTADSRPLDRRAGRALGYPHHAAAPAHVDDLVYMVRSPQSDR